MKSKNPKADSARARSAPIKSGTIRVDYMARVEGEGALHVKIKDGKVREARFAIFEPPRFFEAFLRGRDFREAPDITSRICGICPIAYQMSSIHAMEDALGVKIEGPLRELRRLIYCGEWIESHVLHVAMLHAPDFLGYNSAIEMAKDHPDIVKAALGIKKAGNEIVRVLGGREIHPINLRVGGFYYAPTKRELAVLKDPLQQARDAALGLTSFVAGLPFPGFEQDYDFIALRHPSEYPFNEGQLVSSAGLNIPVHDYGARFREEQVSYSTTLHTVLATANEEPTTAFLVGPVARVNLNFDHLSPMAKETARAAGFATPCRNPFRSIIARSVEVVHACEEALRIIEAYEPPDAPAAKIEPRAGKGFGCTEAPRGILYHRYEIDEAGSIIDADIVPPTAVNQKAIERDVRHFVEANASLPKDKLQWQCEQSVRNYDPCISCATHLLTVEVE